MRTIFKNREDAGRRLAGMLQKYRNSEAVILALPRGGVVVGKIIAEELNLPLGIIVVRKVGHPLSPEYAVAAVTESGEMVKNAEEVENLDPELFKQAAEEELAEAKRRRQKYWGDRPEIDLQSKIAIIVDDGLATGLTMLAAIKEVRSKNPEKIVVAVPVSPADTAQKIGSQIDELVSIFTPEDFAGAVGAYYVEFPQVSDMEVINILNNHKT